MGETSLMCQREQLFSSHILQLYLSTLSIFYKKKMEPVQMKYTIIILDVPYLWEDCIWLFFFSERNENMHLQIMQ